MALFRAIEDAQPSSKRLFHDPFAAGVLDGRLALVARAARLPLIRSAISTFMDLRWPGARTSAVARTRFIDDELRCALVDGIGQVVLLGAGFDARAYRIAGMEKCRVYEVDHPATLTKKRDAVTRTHSPAAHVTFVPTDFNERRIQDVMREAGWEASSPTFFLWEGVTNYLSESAVDATLGWCAGAAARSRLLFTYVDRRVLEEPGSFYGTAKLFRTLAKAGEKWTFGLNPAETGDFLRARGFSLRADLGAADYRAMYFQQRAEHMRGYEFYRIAVCDVGSRAASAAPRDVER